LSTRDILSERSGRWGLYRQVSPPPARHYSRAPPALPRRCRTHCRTIKDSLDRFLDGDGDGARSGDFSGIFKIGSVQLSRVKAPD
jgi:hypothetical protein